MAAGTYSAKRPQKRDWRLNVVRGFFVVFGCVIVVRLFTLQVVNASFYQALAEGQHSFYQELFSERGDILVKDWMEETEYLAATNEPRAFVFADPRRIENPVETAQALAAILGYNMEPTPNAVEEVELVEEEIDPMVEGEEEVEEEPKTTEYERLLGRLSKTEDPYEPVARNVTEETLARILALNLSGIDYVLQKTRVYPETNLGGHIFGFVGSTDDGGKKGFYGLEGYFNEFLAGKNGFIDSETDASGRWIGVGSRTFEPAVDGGDLLLTIDRTVQYVACRTLREATERFGARGGSLVILEPKTGAIIAMCGAPDYDPNVYSEVEEFGVYNNRAVSVPYEPGSVFKPIVMAAAIDTGAVTPTTLFEDKGEEKIDEYTIRNSDLKANGIQSMTNVLEKSLNTGMIFVMRQLGMDNMQRYIEDFGFGRMTGVELMNEVDGNVSSLNVKAEIFYATASYGQGITVTPIQLAAAYGALANGGALMQPYLVAERRKSDGSVEVTKPKVVRQVISKKTATTIGAMMVSVVENGHGEPARVPGYYVAGKTGTAQVAKERGVGYEVGYTKATFAGFAPVEDPRFVMVLMFDKPSSSEWASGTSAPLFGELATFLLRYFEVAPTRPNELQ